MTANGPRLALGTVQFGVGYGIAGGNKAVPEQEVRHILEAATVAGLRFVDTAPGYGTIEQRLAVLCAGLDLRVISKIPALPDAVAAIEAARFALQSACTSRERLGAALDALLLHRGEDLLGSSGDAVWRVLEDFGQREGVRIGVSCYDVSVLDRVRRRFPVAIAQMPGNAFDQRIHAGLRTSFDGLELHLRSAFLQGLLLMGERAASARLPAATARLRHWHAWLADHELDALTACLGIVKGLPHVAFCVVGVDGMRHFEAIVAAWHAAAPLQAPELASVEPSIIDPRSWKLHA